VSPKFDEDLLHGIIGLVRNHAPGQRPDQAPITINAIANRRLIAFGDTDQQVGRGIGQGSVLSGIDNGTQKRDGEKHAGRPGIRSGLSIGSFVVNPG
jgi:hypothetical protein